MAVTLLRAQIEKKYPSAFAVYRRSVWESIRTGIPQIDRAVEGIPLYALTEICGSSLASSGKTSVMISLIAQTTQERFCALVDASDGFDPQTGHAAGINFSKLLWVRCGKNKVKLNRLEQAFKVTDMLLQSSGFGLIVVDLSNIPEKFVRNVPLSSWFRFSRVVENQPAALVFVTQQPHATSCARLVLRLTAGSPTFSGRVLTKVALNVDVLRTREKKGAHSVAPEFSMKAHWA